YPDGHAFLIAYDKKIVDMTAYGGFQNATVVGLILQELDANHDVVFEWRSWDHFQFTDANSSTPLTASIVDYVHGNSIEKDYDGNILISCRNMHEVTKIDHETGDIIWRLGGENNMFTFVDDNIPEHFHSQHDVRRIANGNITLYNNGNALPVFISSAKEYSLDEANKVATLVWYYEHPDVNGNHVFVGATGSVQRLPNGNTLIDWGLLLAGSVFPNFTEVDMNKNIVWEMKFDSGGQTSYRVHKYSWNPCSRITRYTMNVTEQQSNIVLNWGPATGAKKYEVNYRQLGAASWSTKITSRIKTVLPGLTPSLYEWKVKTICSNNGSVTSAYSATDTFNLREITYASDDVDEALQIFPVPAHDHIIISLNHSLKADVYIYDAVGSLVYKNKVAFDDGNAFQVDVSQWSAGVSLMQLKDDEHFVTRKIIVE